MTDQFSGQWCDGGGVSPAISSIMVYIVMSFFWAAQAVKYLRHIQFFFVPTICKLIQYSTSRTRRLATLSLAFILRNALAFLRSTCGESMDLVRARVLNITNPQTFACSSADNSVYKQRFEFIDDCVTNSICFTG